MRDRPLADVHRSALTRDRVPLQPGVYLLFTSQPLHFT